MGERIAQADSFSKLKDLMLKDQDHIFVIWNLPSTAGYVHTRSDIAQ